MNFRILGPPQVLTDRGPVRLTGRRERTALAVLLVNPHRVVPLEHLVDALWDDDPPPTARRQVQNCVAALRRAIGDGSAPEPVIVVERAGYRIRPADGALDAQVFAQQVARGQRLAAGDNPAAAVLELRSALRLWRGPALSGLAGRTVEAAATKLEEQRFAALEQCLDLELALGRAPELIGELTELAAAHPLREKVVGQLMLALYQGGRQADALQAYQRLREALDEELGIDPGPPLRELHAAILANVPDLSPTRPSPAVVRVVSPAPVPAQLPADVIGYTGRAEHLNRLDDLVATDAGVVIAILSGTGGVGKTSLAVHWAHRMADRFPDGRLFVNLRGFDPGGPPVSPADALRGFLTGLGVAPERIPVDLTERISLYRSQLAGRRVLVVLDNARDAGQVRPLLPGTPGCAALVTSRSQLGGLIAAEGAQPVPVDVLPPEEARDLLARRIGTGRVEAEPLAVDEIIARCARLPLALAVVAARASTQPRLRLAAVADELRDSRDRFGALSAGEQSTDVRAVLSLSYHALDSAAARLFRLLGLHPGPDLAAPAAASMAALPVRQARLLLDDLARAHLVTEHTAGRYTFHDLLRGYAADLARELDTAADRDAAVRRGLEHYLHTAIAADRFVDAHRDPIQVRPPGPGVVTVDQITTHTDAMAWFAAELPVLAGAVEQAAAVGFDEYAWQLAWSMAYFLERQGYWHHWTATHTTALAAGRRLGDASAQAHACRGLGRVNVHLGNVDEARRWLGSALAHFHAGNDPLGQARVHFDFCWIDHWEERAADALYHSEQALDLFRAGGHRSGQARALNNIAACRLLLGDHADAVAIGQRAVDLHEELGDRFGAAGTWHTLGRAQLAAGSYPQAVASFRRAIDLHHDLGNRHSEAISLTYLGDTYQAQGDPDAAAGQWLQALDILDQLGHPDANEVRDKLKPLTPTHP